jgi:Stress responsive A/B Barrel Domain
MKHYNRRDFIATASGLAIVPAFIQQTTTMQEGTVLVHHVFFWLKNPGSAQDRTALMTGLKTLRGIKEVKKLLIGSPASTEKREVVDNSYDVSELMYFNSLEDQATYQDHPIHKAFVEKYSHLWQKVVVYDMLIAE